MSAKYSLTFLALATLSAFAGVAAWQVLGWPAFLFVYAAFSFTLMAAAYAGLGPVVFLKRPDGRLHPLGRLLLGPYLLLNFVTFRLYRWFDSGPASGEVAPNLFFGRRLTAFEASQAGASAWAGVLDLAAEFAEVAPLRRVPRYRSLPVLDATAPTEDQLRDAVGWLRETLPLGPVYVHCALGHGRSATVVLAYLLSAGAVGTIKEGMARLRALRPGVGLEPQQARLLRRFRARGESAA
jgi:protein-tyrosine phosphatase